MKKIIFIILLMLLITGCDSTYFKGNYDKMKLNKEKISGYNIDLRIYGSIGSKTVRKIVRITNYKDKEYEIVNMSDEIEEITNENGFQENEIIVKEKEISGHTEINDLLRPIYIKNNKIYSLGTDGKYQEVDDCYYRKAKLYLESLKKVKKVVKENKEKIGDITYKVSEVVFNKNIIKEIVNDMPIDIEVKSDVGGYIYVDENEYIYRIVYNIKDLVIDINYYGINNVYPIDFPEEIS